MWVASAVAAVYDRDTEVLVHSRQKCLFSGEDDVEKIFSFIGKSLKDTMGLLYSLYMFFGLFYLFNSISTPSWLLDAEI